MPLHIAIFGGILFSMPLQVSKTWELSGPRIARYRETISAISPYCALWGFWCHNIAKRVRYPPPPFLSVSPLGEHAKWGCEYPPPPKGYLSDTRAIPYENKANGCDTPSAILSRKGIARYGGVSRTGPLSKLGTVYFMIRSTYYIF